MKYGIVDAYGQINIVRLKGGSPANIMVIDSLFGDVYIDLLNGISLGDDGTDFNLTTGGGQGSGAGGNIVLNAADGGTSGGGGIVQINAGDAGGAATGGTLELQTGDGGSTGVGGDMTFVAGNGGTVSGNGGRIIFQPGRGTVQGTVILRAPSTGTAPELRFEDAAGGEYVGFKTVGTLLSGSLTYTLPSAAPLVSGYALKSTTLGIMSWDPVGDVAGPGASTPTAIATWNNTSGTLLANNSLQISGIDLRGIDASGAGGNATFRAGDSTGDVGGMLTLRGGTGDIGGGAVQIQGGDATTSGDTGGVGISTFDAPTSADNAGDINLLCGDNTASSNENRPGSIRLIPGASSSTLGGKVFIDPPIGTIPIIRTESNTEDIVVGFTPGSSATRGAIVVSRTPTELAAAGPHSVRAGAVNRVDASSFSPQEIVLPAAATCAGQWTWILKTTTAGEIEVTISGGESFYTATGLVTTYTTSTGGTSRIGLASFSDGTIHYLMTMPFAS
jgi:hypothetical protein